MTSWILSISKDFPQHWNYAKRDQVWDLRTKRDIQGGDIVYFWLAKGSLLGRGMAARDIRDSPAVGLPWDDANGDTTYTGRIDFEWTEDYDGPPMSWTELKSATGISGAAHLAPRSSDTVVEANLAALFGAVDLQGQVSLPPSVEKALETLADPDSQTMSEDKRERVLAEIRLRQGQPRFRKNLLNAYRRTCAVTGTETEAVLEAAHILPYKGEHTNVTPNGLLLRSDVHTLFDSLLLTVVPGRAHEFTIRVAPEVRGGPYPELDRRPLVVVPANPENEPSAEFLGEHASQCTWLSRANSTSADYRRVT